MNAGMLHKFTALILIGLWPLQSMAANQHLVPLVTGTSGHADTLLGAASLGQFAFGLIAVVSLIFGLAWLLRRMKRIQGSVQGQLRILAGLPLGSRERIVLIQVGDEQILLGVAPGRVACLHVLQQPLEEKTTTSGAAGGVFRARLSEFMQRGSSK